MLDIKYIRQNTNKIKQGAIDKNFDPRIIDEILLLDSEIRPLLIEIEQGQNRRKCLSETLAKTSEEGKRLELKAEVIALKQRLETRRQKHDELKKIFNSKMLWVPMPSASEVPIGKNDTDNQEIRRWGEQTNFSFTPQNHINLGRRLKLIDLPRGVKLAGSRSYVLTGWGARLEQAILRFTYDFLISKDYLPLSVPVLVKENAMESTGYFPVGREQAYLVEKDALALIGTSEVSIAGFHREEILDRKDLPLKYMAMSHCFRREAGSYGKDTSGLYRVHQFQKIEQVIIAPASTEISSQLYEEILDNSEKILRAFKLPYRVVKVCTGDLGQGQVMKHDLETWMPSRNAYGETHSCSSFFDFQARRLKLRYRSQDQKKIFCYTLNNTAIASPRILIPFLENHQQPNGSIWIPKPLRPYLDGKEFIL